MEKRKFYGFDLLPSLLSTFDISGFFLVDEGKPSKGLEYDIEQLSRDHLLLLEDYRKASERIKNEMDQLCGDKCPRH
jgi:hypothetical protein